MVTMVTMGIPYHESHTIFSARDILGFPVAKLPFGPGPICCEDRPVSRLHPNELGGAVPWGTILGGLGTGNLEVSKIMGVPPNDHPSHE